jgi:hypothetical protein
LWRTQARNRTRAYLTGKHPLRDAAEGNYYFEHFEKRRSKLKTDYLPVLERWRRFYPAERIFVGFLEDVNFYPGRFLARLYRFLEVSPEAAPRPSRHRSNRGTGRGPTMPASQAAYLAQIYRGHLERLDARFGGYASFWRFCAERLVEKPLTEDVPYPPLPTVGIPNVGRVGADPAAEARFRRCRASKR